MSESEGSDSPDGGRVEYGKVALAIAVVTALVVAAALLPGAGVGGGMDGSERGAATTGTPGATAEPGGERSDRTSSGDTLPGGSPSGVPLSQPPDRTRIGSTQGFKGELAQTPQFVVEGPENTYWRQTAYTRYTGSAWASSPQWRSISAGVPNDAQTTDGRAIDYRITLLVPSSSLPTAWQPSSVRVPNASAGVEASTVGGVRATRRLPAGTEYLARSAAPPSDPATLRDAGTDYPDRVAERYTQLPESTPERVGAFTDELTADDETPYDEAVTVRNWLRQKPYSLNASHEAGEPVADQFIFEMESGYCQYYATSMVVMLRTQEIPARYVVGYAPGERVGEREYLVTADRGHAWVEVFFPGTGWVRFDPTGSGQLPVQNPQPPYDISLNRSAVAGASVSISVTKNDTPVVGAPVEINDERVGWTGADGTVTTQLPYAPEFTVTARSPDAETKYDGEEGETTADLWAGGAMLPAGGGMVIGADPEAPPITAQRKAPTANGSSRTYRSDTNVTLTVEGTPVSGGGMTVRAMIRDVPVRGATVTLDGERVGTTGPDGRLGVSLGDVTPGEHRLAVQRESVGATTTVRVYAPGAEPPTAAPPPLNLSVSAPLLALPGGSATVTTTRNGTPVAGARVTVGESEAGTTTENGTLGVSLPFSGATTVVARGPDEASAQVTLPLGRNAAVVGVGALAGLALIGRTIRRRGVTPRSAGRAATAWLSRLVAWATVACVRAADFLAAAGRALRHGLRRLTELPEELATRGLAALVILDPRRLVGWLRRWLAGLLVRPGSATETDGISDERRGATASGPDVGTDEPSTATLRDLWREFVGLVSPPRATTRTPGEIARYAIERGLPADPIRALTDAYRDAEYGRLAPDANRLARARDALRAVREAVRGGGK